MTKEEIRAIVLEILDEQAQEQVAARKELAEELCRQVLGVITILNKHLGLKVGRKWQNGR